MARKTKAEAAETRQQVLDAALEVFFRKGYSRATFVDIAKEIGLSKGAVYWHFKTKPDLLVALIEEMVERKQQLVPSLEGVESLAEFRSQYLESFRIMFSDPLLYKFESFINFQIEWSDELWAEVQMRLDRVAQGSFMKYIQALVQLQNLGVIPSKHDVEKLGTSLIAAQIGLARLVMMELVPEADLVDRIVYSFDNTFRNIVKEEQ